MDVMVPVAYPGRVSGAMGAVSVSVVVWGRCLLASLRAHSNMCVSVSAVVSWYMSSAFVT